MFKRDALFWWASGIFLAALLLGAFVSEEFLLLLVAANLLRPTVNALGLAGKSADERQLQIQFHAGNLALTVLIVAVALFALRAERVGAPADDFYALLAVGLATKALVGLVMIGDYRSAGVRIAVTIGALVLLFSLFDAWNDGPLEILLHASPGLIVVAIGLLGRRLPRVSAALLAVFAVVVIVYGAGRFTMPGFVIAFIVGAPLLAAAFCFGIGGADRKLAGPDRI
ncbi:MAG: hypothetical protein R6X25_00670 [Candidatus Krumholzibacteriia bacterium]